MSNRREAKQHKKARAQYTWGSETKNGFFYSFMFLISDLAIAWFVFIALAKCCGLCNQLIESCADFF